MTSVVCWTNDIWLITAVCGKGHFILSLLLPKQTETAEVTDNNRMSNPQRLQINISHQT